MCHQYKFIDQAFGTMKAWIARPTSAYIGD